MALFVTDGEQRATLAVVRALGRVGVPVTVGASGKISLAGTSRYCTRNVCCPCPEKEPERFQAFLCRHVRETRYRLLLPVTDVTTQLVSGVRAALAPYVGLPLPDDASIRRVQDKRFVLSKAQELGIACPQTFMVEGQETLEGVSQRMAYPAVIKPRFSRYFCDGHWRSGTVQYALHAADLIAKYQEAHQEIPNPLIQERIRGEGRGVFVLMWGGELKAAFCHRRLREKPPWGGVSVYSESVPLDQKLVQQSVDLLKACGWQGVAMVEYKVDPRDGYAKFMEVNGRFWGSLQLAIDAGINFPWLLYRLATGEDVAPQFDYTIGVRSRWLLGDLDHLWIRLARPSAVNGLPDHARSKLRACLDFIKLYEPGLHYDVQRFDDPGPGWYECKSYVRSVLGRLVGRRERISAT
jgi:predicted ATP-grasp superfamily ATP-dependent carboligase